MKFIQAIKSVLCDSDFGKCFFLIIGILVSVNLFGADELDPSQVGPPAPNELIDSRGINIVSGVNSVSGMAVSIGGADSSLAVKPGPERLGRDNLTSSLTLLVVKFGQTPSNQKKEPALVRSMKLADGQYFQVDALGYSELFYAAPVGLDYKNVGGVLPSVSKMGGALTCNSASNTCEYVSKNGEVVKFDRNIRSHYTHLLGHVTEYNIGYATSAIKPDGEVLTYYYQKVTGYQSFGYLDSLPSAVVSSLGWMIKYSFNDFSVTKPSPFSSIEHDSRSICAINLVKEYVDVSSANCAQLNSQSQWPIATLSRDVSAQSNSEDPSIYTVGVTTNVTNPGGGSDSHYRVYGMSSGDQKEVYISPEGVKTTYDIGDFSFNSWDLYTSTPSTGKLLKVEIGGVSFAYGHEADPVDKIDDDNGDGIDEHIRTGPDGTYEIDDYDRLIAFTNKLGARKKYHYHSVYVNQIERIDYPDGRYTTYSYDGRGNVTHAKEYPSGDGGVPLVTSVEYWVCSLSSQKYCNKPKSITTPDGAVTTYTYYSAHGGVNTITKPAVVIEGVQVSPVTVYSYTQHRPYAKFNSQTLTAAPQDIWRITKVSACRTAATCFGGINELISSAHYDIYENLLPDYKTTELGDGSISLKTSFEYDQFGNLVKSIGPHSNEASYTFYDERQRIIGSISPDANGRALKGIFTKYNKDNQVTYKKTGFPGYVSLGALKDMVPFAEKSTTFDPANGLPVAQKNMGADVDELLIEMTYDSQLRLSCKALRVSGISNINACSSSGGYFGQDRVTKYDYNDLNQVIKTTSGFGTSVARIDREDVYNSLGVLVASKDGKQNRTEYKYDAYGRLIETWYPNPTVINTANSNDREVTTYEGTRVKTVKLRSGAVVTFLYDAWGRVTQKTGAITEVFSYDLFNNVINHQNSTSGVLSTFVNNKYYNAFGWKEYEETVLGRVSYKYDNYGRRTELKWPDGFYITYDYADSLLLQGINEGAANNLIRYSYDPRDRLEAITRANSVTTEFEYDDFSRIKGISTDVAGSSTVDDYQVNFDYNPVSQVVSKALSVQNQNYKYIPANVSESYSINGLNQVTSWSGSTLGYDSMGNLSQIGAMTYSYNSNNQLTKAGSVNLYYDAENRLHKVGASCFMYDGAKLIAETDCSGTVVNRYVHGIGTDEPIVWYVGSGVGTRRFFTKDYQGSIIGATSNSGTSVAINAYDEFGVPAITNTGRFQYTGQVWLSEVGLYYYKARFYHPRLGRFMQTDPIGYKDGMNWYAYVGNNPTNSTDPTGLHRYDSMLCSSPYACGNGADASEAQFNMAVMRANARQVHRAFMEKMQHLAKFNSLSDLATKIEVTNSGVRPGIAPADPEDIPHLEKMQALAQEAADEVDSNIDNVCTGSCRWLPWLKPMVRGTAIHKVFADKVRAENISYDAEVSYKDGVVVPYGTAGSVRGDAIYGDINRPQFVVELKTGMFNYMSVREARAYLENLPSGTPLYPLKVD